MSGNTIGTLFTVTSFGESHGPAIGCVVDGCPPGLAICEADIQAELDRRKPGTSRHVTQRREPDAVEICRVFGKTTGAPLACSSATRISVARTTAISRNSPSGHTDYTYWQKYGIRDYRGAVRRRVKPRCMAAVRCP
jgi:chorismate synthase